VSRRNASDQTFVSTSSVTRALDLIVERFVPLKLTHEFQKMLLVAPRDVFRCRERVFLQRSRQRTEIIGLCWTLADRELLRSGPPPQEPHEIQSRYHHKQHRLVANHAR
jgi:hypothetical protein